MKRFRTKKRSKEEGVRASEEQERPQVPALKATRTFRRAKKSKEPEPRKEFDVANALPAHEDFRTSLLMSGLSARFSMLREQDDPTTKIGKASDDSVLFPRRQSRLGDFGFHGYGLSDIAEVASINSSVRRPFASDRIDSYHSDVSGTDDDGAGASVMARSRPGEGNTLFGGRQKIYKIPTGSSKNLAANGEVRTMGGRVLYDDDVGQSAFQKLREKERAEREYEQLEKEDIRDELPRRSESPPMLGYNRDRETSSTSSDGPSLTRSSTAATSITSQRTPSVKGYNTASNNFPPHSNTPLLERSQTKNKRLYETGSDHHLHSQQMSSANRLENLTRQRALETRSPSPSPYFNTSGGFDNSHGQNAWGQANLKPVPAPSTPAAFGAFDFGVKPTGYTEISKPSYGVMPPLSPPMSDVDEQGSLPIQPNDRGKATAAGVFSKPAQPYDEKKYTLRQLQMQHDRETTPSRKQSTPGAFNPNKQDSSRNRAESNATNISINSQSSTNSQALLQNLPPTSHLSAADELNFKSNPASATFLMSPMGSDVDSPRNTGSDTSAIWTSSSSANIALRKNSNSPDTDLQPLRDQHPAIRLDNNRSQRLYRDYTEMHNDPIPSPSISEVPVSEQARKIPSHDPPADSPATSGPGLKGMVLQHLRSGSNSSSIFGAPSPGLGAPSPGLGASSPSLGYRFGGGQPANRDVRGNSLLPHDWDQMAHRDVRGNSLLSHDWDQSADLSPRVSNAGANGAFMPLNQHPVEYSIKEQTPVEQDLDRSAWERQMAAHHSRDGSTETQKERREFANELATRRKQVQQNLRSFAESDSRSESPAPGLDWPKDINITNSNPQGLKSRGSNREGQSKAMKLLGMGSSSVNTSPRKQKVDDNLWMQEEEEMLRNMPQSSRALPENKAFRQARREAQRDRERQALLRRQSQKPLENSESDGGQSSNPSESGNERSLTNIPRTAVGSPIVNGVPSQFGNHLTSQAYIAPRQEGRESSAPSHLTARDPYGNGRDRSSSDASVTSKTRNGRYRDDLAKAMAEGIGSSAKGSYEDAGSVRVQMKSPAFPTGFQNSAHHSPLIPSTHRSPGYFEGQLQPVQTNNSGDGSLPSRASPITPFSANTTPALQPSPIGPGGSMPPIHGFPGQVRIAPAIKRLVNKADISEPTLVSTTSRITTITRPAAAAMQAELGYQFPTPALPPLDPRRMHQKGQAMNGSPAAGAALTMPPDHPDEMSAFSGDEADHKLKQRPKLRKSSSDGGNLHARTRQAFSTTPSPAIPPSPIRSPPSPLRSPPSPLRSPPSPLRSPPSPLRPGGATRVNSREGGMF